MAHEGRFLFVTWAGGGNVNPLLALTARLQQRGHGVRVLGPRGLGERFAAEGDASGAGIALPKDSDAAALRARVQELLDEPRYSNAARRVAAAMTAGGNGQHAVTELEGLLATAGAPPRSAGAMPLPME